MGEKITVAEWRMLKKHLAGKYSPFEASAAEIEAMNSLLAKAEEALAEKDAYDEMGDDLLAWYADQHVKGGVNG